MKTLSVGNKEGNGDDVLIEINKIYQGDALEVY